jgi:hypothetical protein
MPSCNHQHSCCQLLLPPIVLHHRPCCHCRCHRAATATTATMVVELIIVYCQRNWQQQQHHQRTNSAPTSKHLHVQMTWTYLTYLQYFHPLGCVLQYLYVLQYLQFFGDFRHKILVSGYFLCWHRHAYQPKIGDFLTHCRRVADMSPTLPAKVLRTVLLTAG